MFEYNTQIQLIHSFREYQSYKKEISVLPLIVLLPSNFPLF